MSTHKLVLTANHVTRLFVGPHASSRDEEPSCSTRVERVSVLHARRLLSPRDALRAIRDTRLLDY